MKYSEQPLKLYIKRDTLKIYNKWNDILKHVCEYESRKNTIRETKIRKEIN